MAVNDLLREQIRLLEEHSALLERALDDERGYESDGKIAQHADQVKKIVATFESDISEADKTNTAGFYMYSAEEREARKAAAVERRDAALAKIVTEHEQMGTQLATIDTAIADLGQKRLMPFAWATPEEQARAETMRVEVQRQLAHSTPREIAGQAEAVVRSSDWIRARVWHDELSEYLSRSPSQSHERVVELLPMLRTVAKSPALEAEAARLQKVHDKLQDRYRAFTAALGPARVANDIQQLRQTGQYERL